MAEKSWTLHLDSGVLWSQLQGKVDRSFKDILLKLDEVQENEDISPHLADTIRDIFFQLSLEDPSRLNMLRIRAASPDGPLLKYVLTQLEDSGGNYRLRKSAELIGTRTGRDPQDIMVEYQTWQGNE